MRKLVLFIILLFSALIAQAQVLDDAIEKLSKEVSGQVVLPKTTAELKDLFKDANLKKIPRIFVDRLPDDFAQNGTPELYTQVITALILRENERIIKEKMLLSVLKAKYDKKQTWTQTEEAFFNSLVEKYDVTVTKTKDTQLEKLMLKVDEIVPGLAVAQSVYATDWGKKNMNSPYAQKGWLDENTYADISYDSLIKATEEYVKELNAAPCHWLWRTRRRAAAHQRARQFLAFSLAGTMAPYLPEDPHYAVTLRQILDHNRPLGELYQAEFMEQGKKK